MLRIYASRDDQIERIWALNKIRNTFCENLIRSGNMT